MSKQPIKIKKDEENPESVELLAKSIIQVSEASENLLNGPLKKDTIVLLLHSMIGANNINKTQIKLVLENLPRLKAWYLK